MNKESTTVEDRKARGLNYMFLQSEGQSWGMFFTSQDENHFWGPVNSESHQRWKSCTARGTNSVCVCVCINGQLRRFLFLFLSVKMAGVWTSVGVCGCVKQLGTEGWHLVKSLPVTLLRVVLELRTDAANAFQQHGGTMVTIWTRGKETKRNRYSNQRDSYITIWTVMRD